MERRKLGGKVRQPRKTFSSFQQRRNFLPLVCWSRETMQGRVKFFNVERGYGFVHNEAGSWWFHRTYCRGDPPGSRRYGGVLAG